MLMGLVCILQKKTQRICLITFDCRGSCKSATLSRVFLALGGGAGRAITSKSLFDIQVFSLHTITHNKTDLLSYSSLLILAVPLMMYSESRVYSAPVREALNARFVARRMNAALLRSPALYSRRKSGRQSQ